MAAAAKKKRKRKIAPPKAGAGTFPAMMLVVEQSKTGFRLTDPQLEITVRGSTLAEAFDKLRETREMVMAKLAEAGFPAPPNAVMPHAAHGYTAYQPPQRHRSGLFMALSVAAVVLIGALLAIPVLNGISAVQAGITRIKEMAKPEIAARHASDSLVTFAKTLQLMSPDRREEVRKSLRIIAEELRPLVLELAPLAQAIEGESQKAGEASDATPAATGQ